MEIHIIHVASVEKSRRLGNRLFELAMNGASSLSAQSERAIECTASILIPSADSEHS
jgi:hypothetical protein